MVYIVNSIECAPRPVSLFHGNIPILDVVIEYSSYHTFNRDIKMLCS